MLKPPKTVEKEYKLTVCYCINSLDSLVLNSLCEYWIPLEQIQDGLFSSSSSSLESQESKMISKSFFVDQVEKGLEKSKSNTTGVNLQS